ncbi:MAG: hypothetical protein RSD78_02480 [Oscillospiraceae bacterium]
MFKKRTVYLCCGLLIISAFTSCAAKPPQEKIISDTVTTSNSISLNEPSAVSTAENKLLPAPKILDMTADLAAAQKSNTAADWATYNEKYPNLNINYRDINAQMPNPESMSVENAADIAAKIAEGFSGYNLRDAEVPMVCGTLSIYQGGKRQLWQAEFTCPEKLPAYGDLSPRIHVYIDAISGDLLVYGGLQGRYDLMDDRPGIPEDVTPEITKLFNDTLYKAFSAAGLGAPELISWDGEYHTTAKLTTGGKDFSITMGSIEGLISSIYDAELIPALPTSIPQSTPPGQSEVASSPKVK